MQGLAIRSNFEYGTEYYIIFFSIQLCPSNWESGPKYSDFVYFLSLSLSNAANQTQGFTHAKQLLPPSYALNPAFFFLMSL
jgi:hypothetical protein